MKYLDEIIVPYLHCNEGLDESQKTLVIMDVSIGQMTPKILDSYKACNICVVNVQANMTKYYQPLNLTIICEAKCSLKRKFFDGIHIKFQINSVKGNL